MIHRFIKRIGLIMYSVIVGIALIVLSAISPKYFGIYLFYVVEQYSKFLYEKEVNENIQ